MPLAATANPRNTFTRSRSRQSPDQPRSDWPVALAGMDAIDAIGYLVQTRCGEAVTHSEFRLFGGVPEWKHEVLEKAAEAETDEYLGNLYASDWIYDPTHQEPDREVRLLALGPIPDLTSLPL